MTDKEFDAATKRHDGSIDFAESHPRSAFNMTTCITPNCHYPQAPALKRGLCMRCYTSAKAAVDGGGVTWEELVGLGLAQAESESDPFTIALKNKLEGK